MILKLFISNLILIESAEIDFARGLNILSGETGSGKSALMEALKLAAGGRSDTGIIRRGADKGVVEVYLDVTKLTFLKPFFEEQELEWTATLCIRREITLSGKSRALVNDHLVSLAVLKQISGSLLEIVGQHANQRLLDVHQHRIILDTFGELKNEVLLYQTSWKAELAKRKELEKWIASESARIRELESAQHEFEEINQAKLKEGEEEELFTEYALLSNAEERSNKSKDLEQGLAQAQMLIRKLNTSFDKLIHLDPSVQEFQESFNSLSVEIDELHYTFEAYYNKIDKNPNKLEQLDERLALITRLKRKYGSSVTEILAYAQNLQQKLQDLQNSDAIIEELQQQVQALEQLNQQRAAQITKKRSLHAKKLTQAMQTELIALNMSKAIFEVDLTFQKRNEWGDDIIEFYLTPNVGENRVPIRECASGGELSRLMLALQTLLSGKEAVPTLVFDEIDANIGGATASVVGQKLKKLGQDCQVLCITHFPQVAQQGDHHLQISKVEQDGRTFSIITLLDEKMRQQELQRMQGGSIIGSQ